MNTLLGRIDMLLELLNNLEGYLDKSMIDEVMLPAVTQDKCRQQSRQEGSYKEHSVEGFERQGDEEWSFFIREKRLILRGYSDGHSGSMLSIFNATGEGTRGID